MHKTSKPTLATQVYKWELTREGAIYKNLIHKTIQNATSKSKPLSYLHMHTHILTPIHSIEFCTLPVLATIFTSVIQQNMLLIIYRKEKLIILDYKNHLKGA